MKSLGAQVELVKSSGGVFEVEYGGEVLFSKTRTGRFPKKGELMDLIRASPDFFHKGSSQIFKTLDS